MDNCCCEMPIAPRGPPKLCGGSVNAGTEVQTRTGRVRKASRAMGAHRGASFDPMAAILRCKQGGRIYNNTRARVLLRRMCVKPADRTTHSPPKTFAHPRTATRPPRALPLPHAAPMHARRLRDAFPADLTTHSPQRHAASPSVPLRAQKKRHRTVHVRCRMSRSTVVAVGHLGW